MNAGSQNFSSLERAAILDRLRQEPFDLLIIGGGITGAGIALDAASRGLKTALVERKDFAFGTSSRSTKLIHGGLRYLKQLEFALVKEVGSERAIVHRLARHLVVPEKMLLPLYERRGLGYWLTSIGLMLYDWLAGVKPEDQRKMMTRSQTLSTEPLLKKDDVKGGAIYAEYRTDDARLTIEIAKLASRYGAVLTNYCSADDFLYSDGKVCGARVTDVMEGKSFEIKAASVVNAAGPWVDELRELNRSRTEKFLHLTKGVHIVVPFHRLPVRQAIYFDVPDGRMIFAIPRGRITYIGTTDTDYSGDKDHVYTTQEDARYLIDAVNGTFSSVNLTLADIEASWAGLRPLIHEEGKSASELSRKDELFESPSGLLSIAGGKLTGYRKMAERVVDHLIQSRFTGRSLKPCSTETMVLAEGGFSTDGDVRAYDKDVALRADGMGLKGGDASYLVHLYGKQTETILNHAAQNRTDDPEVDLALAKLWFGIRHEMIVKPEDFFVRRTGLLYFNIHRLMKVKDHVLAALAKVFSWSEDRSRKEKEELELLILKTLAFRG